MSTDDQKLRLQRDELRATGCDKLFEEKHSAARGPLPAREELLAFARRGDVVVVWKPGPPWPLAPRPRPRWSPCSAREASSPRSLHESIDTTTPVGKLSFHLFAALAEMEAEVLRERTRAGLSGPRRRGSKLVSPRAVSQYPVEVARSLLDNT